MEQWFSRLLLDDISQDFRSNLPEIAKQEARSYLQAFPKEIADPVEKADLDRWYQSDEGQLTLVALFERAWSQMNSVAPWAMPAHDARHAMFKVPATSLEYLQSENVQGYERIGVLAALLHDYGRWAEERIFGHPGIGVIHARLSFLLTRELLSKFEMPSGIRTQIEHAVLQHTTGADDADVMPTKLVVSADRDQLYGPEVVLRLMHHVTNCQDNDLATVFGETPGRSVLDRLMNFCCVRLPGPLFSRQAHVDELYAILRTFILMAEPADRSEKRFQRAERTMNGAHTLQGKPWRQAWNEANALRPPAQDAGTAMRALLMAKHTAPQEQHRADALRKLRLAPSDCLESLAGALVWVDQRRTEQDERQILALTDIAGTYADDIFVSTIARLLAMSM